MTGSSDAEPIKIAHNTAAGELMKDVLDLSGRLVDSLRDIFHFQILFYIVLQKNHGLGITHGSVVLDGITPGFIAPANERQAEQFQIIFDNLIADIVGGGGSKKAGKLGGVISAENRRKLVHNMKNDPLFLLRGKIFSRIKVIG